MALSRGPMSVISPITAVLAAAGPLTFGLAAGERPGSAAMAGVAAALAGTFLVSVIAALYPAFAVALAITHGRERMRVVQLAGLCLAGVAIVLLTLS